MSAMQDVATGLGSECELVGSLSWQVGFLCGTDVATWRALAPSSSAMGHEHALLRANRRSAAPSEATV